MLGCVIRDIERKCSNPEGRLAKVLNIARKTSSIRKETIRIKFTVFMPRKWNVLPRVRFTRKYEFGCKVSMVSSSKDNWILAIDAVHGNPFDGHTLKDALQQVKQITGWQPLHAYCDRGYRGVAKEIPETEVHLSGKKKKSMKASLWKWYARRSAIEPIFGHLKSDQSIRTESSPGKRR